MSEKKIFKTRSDIALIGIVFNKKKIIKLLRCDSNFFVEI